MQKKPIIVFADETDLSLYRDVLTEEEHAEEYHLLEAERVISAKDPEMVLLDCGFTPEIGLTILHRIKSSRPHVPVIFLTDVSSEAIAVGAFRAGAFDYLSKPADIPALRGTIRNLLGLKRSQRETRVRASRRAPDENTRVPAGDLPAELMHVVCHIDNNLHSSLTVDGLAREANLSKYYFCRHFRKHIGMTPMKFVLSRRVEIAKKMLQQRNDLNISMIAFKVGYLNVNNFIKAFKNLTGLTPFSYRKFLKRHYLISPKGNIRR